MQKIKKPNDMTQQVFLIHGGHVHHSYEAYLQCLRDSEIDLDKNRLPGWKDHLEERLGVGFEVVRPRMPCKENAKYSAWQIWFEKHIPFLQDGVIFVGHSLGGLFLAKYLNESPLSVKVKATILVAAPFSVTVRNPDELADFHLGGDFTRLSGQAGHVVMYHSLDDQVVPYSNAQSYLERLPQAHLETFENRGHFNQETFPELEDKLRELSGRT